MERPGRPTNRVDLDADQRKELVSISRKRKAPRELPKRAKIVLECAKGLPDRRVAGNLGVSAQDGRQMA